MLTYLYLNEYRSAIDECHDASSTSIPDESEVFAYRGNAYAYPRTAQLPRGCAGPQALPSHART